MGGSTDAGAHRAQGNTSIFVSYRRSDAPSASGRLVGDVLAAQGRLDAALQAFAMAREITHALLAKVPTHPVWLADLRRIESCIAACRSRS